MNGKKHPLAAAGVVVRVLSRKWEWHASRTPKSAHLVPEDSNRSLAKFNLLK